MFKSSTILRSYFATISHIRGKAQRVDTKNVKLRGVHIKSTSADSPNLIFFPQALDQAQSWLSFFSQQKNKIIHQRNVYIIYPRNLGTSDHSDHFGWEDCANDVARFMYEHKISTATLGGHGLGAKIALAASCYHFDKVTGYFGIDSTPMDQYYHESIREFRELIRSAKQLNIKRGYNAINAQLKNTVLCPKWRNLLLNNLIKSPEGGYQWQFNVNALNNNLSTLNASNLSSWHSSIGLYPGRALFMFPEYSRFVHLSTNTNPMYSVCPRLQGLNTDIFSIQSDDSPLNHWVYEQDSPVNSYALKLSQFLRHYDGVHVLLKNRDEVGNFFIPDLNHTRVNKDDVATDRSPAHYHHNWRFNNIYHK